MNRLMVMAWAAEIEARSSLECVLTYREGGCGMRVRWRNGAADPPRVAVLFVSGFWFFDSFEGDPWAGAALTCRLSDVDAFFLHARQFGWPEEVFMPPITPEGFVT